MIDEIVNACHEVLETFLDDLEKSLDSFLDDLTLEEYRFYARLGLLCALKDASENKNLED